jgi:hypothetical protein
MYGDAFAVDRIIIGKCLMPCLIKLVKSNQILLKHFQHLFYRFCVGFSPPPHGSALRTNKWRYKVTSTDHARWSAYILWRTLCFLKRHRCISKKLWNYHCTDLFDEHRKRIEDEKVPQLKCVLPKTPGYTECTRCVFTPSNRLICVVIHSSTYHKIGKRSTVMSRYPISNLSLSYYKFIDIQLRIVDPSQ